MYECILHLFKYIMIEDKIGWQNLTKLEGHIIH